MPSKQVSISCMASGNVPKQHCCCSRLELQLWTEGRAYFRDTKPAEFEERPLTRRLEHEHITKLDVSVCYLLRK